MKTWLRNIVVVHLLKLIDIPLGDIIASNENGELTISGKTVDIEKASQLRAHARSALENKALHLIREQVVYESFVGAAVKSQKPEDLVFYRAALWYGQRMGDHLRLLAGRDESTVE